MKFSFKIKRSDDPARPKTFVLMWNPAVSSYTMERFENDLEAFAGGGELDDFDWSVWDWEHAEEGDRFVLVRVGEGTTGVVMTGVFTSDPYEGEDWSGKGRRTYYMQMRVDTMIHPDRAPIITTEELTAAMPDFDWTKGHSGRRLPEEYVEKLDSMWEQYMDTHADIFLPRAAQRGLYAFVD